MMRRKYFCLSFVFCVFLISSCMQNSRSGGENGLVFCPGPQVGMTSSEWLVECSDLKHLYESDKIKYIDISRDSDEFGWIFLLVCEGGEDVRAIAMNQSCRDDFEARLGRSGKAWFDLLKPKFPQLEYLIFPVKEIGCKGAVEYEFYNKYGHVCSVSLDGMGVENTIVSYVQFLDNFDFSEHMQGANYPFPPVFAQD